MTLYMRYSYTSFLPDLTYSVHKNLSELYFLEGENETKADWL